MFLIEDFGLLFFITLPAKDLNTIMASSDLNVIKSLIEKIDSTLNGIQVDENIKNTLSDYTESQTELLLPEPAAFEEVCDNYLTSSQKSDVSDIYVCDLLADYIRELNNKDINCIIEQQIGENINISDVSSLNEEDILPHISDDLSNTNPVHLGMLQPCSVVSGSPFHLFNAQHLESSTKFTHEFPFTKRSAVYYGKYPYSYGSTHHPPKPFTDNNYLTKILNYIDIVIPGVKYNSAMIHRYCTGDAFMPHHADDEICIDENSQIVTISFGESRFVEFQNKKTASKTCYKLSHGDVFVMEKSTQEIFTHSIPKDKVSEGTRLSVTLRLIIPQDAMKLKTHEAKDAYSELSSDASLEITNNESQNFLLERESLNDTQPSDNLNLPQEDVIPPQNDRLHQVSASTCHPTRTQTRPKTLYLSDSMFRNLDTTKLSSESQNAIKLFYPGANASQMLSRLKEDPIFKSLEVLEIEKVFVLTGSNNIDNIYYGKNGSSLENTINDITNFLNFLKTSIPEAQIYALNILPRKVKGRCDVINIINSSIKSFCNKSLNRTIYLDTCENKMFVHRDGSRREEFFNPPGRFGEDDVHLNPVGVVRLGKYLKYVAHNI